MSRALLLAVGILVAVTGYSKTITVDKDRMIRVTGEVNGSIIAKATELEVLSRKATSPVFIIINSPGGNVAVGMQFITAMRVAKNRGIRVKCIVPMLAASMAMHFLAECNDRYVFEYTLLLWHPMRVGGMYAAFSADEMEYLIGMMRGWELPLNNKLIDELDISKDLFYYHYKNESLLTGIQLEKISPDFITIIHDVKNIDGLFLME